MQYSCVLNNDTGIRHLKSEEEQRPIVFKNWVLGEVIETKLGKARKTVGNSIVWLFMICWYFTLNVIGVIKSMGMRGVGRVASMAIVFLLPHKLLASSMLLLQTAGLEKMCSFWMVATGLKSVLNLLTL